MLRFLLKLGVFLLRRCSPSRAIPTVCYVCRAGFVPRAPAFQRGWVHTCILGASGFYSYYSTSLLLDIGIFKSPKVANALGLVKGNLREPVFFGLCQVSLPKLEIEEKEESRIEKAVHK